MRFYCGKNKKTKTTLTRISTSTSRRGGREGHYPSSRRTPNLQEEKKIGKLDSLYLRINGAVEPQDLESFVEGLVSNKAS